MSIHNIDNNISLIQEEQIQQIQPTMNSSYTMIRSGDYYSTFYGHRARYLKTLLTSLRQIHTKKNNTPPTCIFLGGDSSLDNKAWLFDNLMQSSQALQYDYSHGKRYSANCVNGYEQLLVEPKGMVKDICYWLNYKLEKINETNQASNSNEPSYFALNTAVEATTLAERSGGCYMCCVATCGRLLESDEVIRDHLTENDYLVVSLGGNDIALAPSIFTVIFLILILLCPFFLLFKYNPIVYYFVILFKHQVKAYLNKVIKNKKPKKIGVCCIYYLDERNGESWANCALFCLCYCTCPSMLQYRIRKMFELATSDIKIKGVEVIPIALSDALDGKSTGDYVQRVEPSISGGQKMANLIISKMFGMHNDTKVKEAYKD